MSPTSSENPKWAATSTSAAGALNEKDEKALPGGGKHSISPA
jgi:hypothetical protein